MSKARLQEFYEANIKPELQKDLALSNPMEVPRLEKIVLNIGLKDVVGESKKIQAIVDVLAIVVGQRPVQTKARKSLAGFKIREGMPIGIKVTLRKQLMYEFLDRLINLALPVVRDFRGVSDKLDSRGNYNLGVKDWVIFPEVDYNVTDRSQGLNITMHTSTSSDEHARALLKAFGMPFKRNNID
jgi:large subunit ribosomal protein L5